MASNDPMRKDPEQWFLDAHPERGTLRVQVSTGRGLFPVEGARVEIYRNFGPERTVFYEGVTDASGIVEDIRRCPPDGRSRRRRRASAALCIRRRCGTPGTARWRAVR